MNPLIQKHIQNNQFHLKVIPNSSRNELTEENGILKLHLQAVPDKNKANLELVRFFKKEFGLRVEIVHGMKSREKIILVLN